MPNKGTILIVEDNALNSEMIKELLEEVGFQTIEAHNADASLQLAKQEHPDLILMDVYMPGKNGYEATRSLKSDPETQDIPILAFTALAMENDRKRAESAGCIGVISKPIDVDTFAATVAAYLQSDFTTAPKRAMSDLVVHSALPEVPEKEVFMKLSHDLQGPIRKINRFTSLLKKSAAEKLSAEDLSFINGIDNATQQLQTVIKSSLTQLNHF